MGQRPVRAARRLRGTAVHVDDRASRRCARTTCRTGATERLAVSTSAIAVATAAVCAALAAPWRPRAPRCARALHEAHAIAARRRSATLQGDGSCESLRRVWRRAGHEMTGGRLGAGRPAGAAGAHLTRSPTRARRSSTRPTHRRGATCTAVGERCLHGRALAPLATRGASSGARVVLRRAPGHRRRSRRRLAAHDHDVVGWSACVAEPRRAAQRACGPVLEQRSTSALGVRDRDVPASPRPTGLDGRSSGRRDVRRATCSTSDAAVVEGSAPEAERTQRRSVDRDAGVRRR